MSDTREGRGAYYNEIDPFAAAWLRELMAGGHIAPGVVDERDIRDVRPDELTGFRQCHFFAGIGVWSYALRRAGWPDDAPIWTGSCPCQPFSTAGKGGGFADERHLWPAFYWLIAQRRPELVVGEQVASKDADPWLDLVQSDLEGMDYAFGCTPVAAAGFGAPNIRERSYWVADPEMLGHEWSGLAWDRRHGLADRGAHGWLADSNDTRLEGWGRVSECPDQFVARQICLVGGMGHAHSQSERRQLREESVTPRRNGGEVEGRVGQRVRPVDGGAITASRLVHANGDGQPKGMLAASSAGHRVPVNATSRMRDERPLHTNGFWRDADWLLCRDPNGPRWRPVEPGTFPLADGTPESMGLIRGSGNAINAEAATGFIEAVIDHLRGSERIAA